MYWVGFGALGFGFVGVDIVLYTSWAEATPYLQDP